MSDAGAPGFWRVALTVPQAAAATFAAALEPVCVTVSILEEAEGVWCIDGLSEAAPDRGALTALVAVAAAVAGVPQPEVRVEPLPAQDWLAQNRESFAPFRVGRFHVSGSDAATAVPSGTIGITVDAGRAFGSGRHASTAGCLLALEGLAKARDVDCALDLGCGSGILAIAIAKLWHAPVLATDIDPDAAAVTRENARTNGVPGLIRTQVAAGVPAGAGADGGFDLVVANILARPLQALARGIAGVVRPGGHLVLAGFLAADAPTVFAAYRPQGLALDRRITLDGWQTLVLRR